MGDNPPCRRHPALAPIAARMDRLREERDSVIGRIRARNNGTMIGAQFTSEEIEILTRNTALIQQSRDEFISTGANANWGAM